MENAAAGWARRMLLVAIVGVAASTAACATENKVTRGPHFTLTHPDFWAVKSVAAADGEPTQLEIGKYSDTGAAGYESLQANVDARIYTFSGVNDNGAPSKKVLELLMPKSDLQLPAHLMMPGDRGECGIEFARKYVVFGQTREAVNLMKRPGFRTIIVGAKNGDILYGVLTRVPHEPDVGLYCHNLRNMQLQLELLLSGFVADVGNASAPAPTAPAGTAAPAGLPPPAPAGLPASTSVPAEPLGAPKPAAP